MEGGFTGLVLSIFFLGGGCWWEVWRSGVSPCWFRRFIFGLEGLDETSGDVNGGVIEEGGGIDSEDRRGDNDDIEVDAEDSLDRTGWRTSISSLIGRLRFRDMIVVEFVFMDDSVAAAAFRFDVEEEDEVRFRV